MKTNDFYKFILCTKASFDNQLYIVSFKSGHKKRLWRKAIYGGNEIATAVISCIKMYYKANLF